MEKKTTIQMLQDHLNNIPNELSTLRLEVERLTKENEGLRADKKAACVAFAEYVSGDAWEFVDGAWVASEWDGEVYRRIEKTSNDLYSEWAAKTPA